MAYSRLIEIDQLTLPVCSSSLPTTIGASDQDFPLSTGGSPVRMRPQPVIQADVMDEEGNLHTADIGITWENNETFLHGVRVVGPGLHDQLEWDRRCRHRTNQWEDETGIDTHIRRPPPEIRQGYRPAAPSNGLITNP